MINSTNRRGHRALPALIGTLVVCCAGCGGGGDGATPRPSPPPPPPPPVTNTFDVPLTAADVSKGSDSNGIGAAVVTHNETDGTLAITVSLSNITATAVSVHTGSAGEIGDERYLLSPGQGAGEWELPSSQLAPTDAAALQTGALYILVSAASEPDGALRGQILGAGINVARVSLEAAQVAAGSSSPASGTAWITLDSNAGEVSIHVVTRDIADVDTVQLRAAAAGTEGPFVAALEQDTTDPSHWLLNNTAYTADMQSAVAAGTWYLTVSSPSNPQGEIRGQLVPEGLELVVSELSDASVVMSSRSAISADVAGRVMTTISDTSFTSHANLYSISDAASIQLRQAPAGQNGPAVVGFAQDLDEPARWSIEAHPIDSSLAAALDAQTLYVEVATGAQPDGAARAQLITEASMQPPDTSAFIVQLMDPENASTVTSLPETVFATLNRAALPSSVGPQSVEITGSGGDGSFADGNEFFLTPSSVSSDGDLVQINLAGIQADDDVYRVSLVGGGPDGIVDVSGIPLDGDQDGQPGGVYLSAFELQTPEPTVSFSEIQQSIFTPTCATSGCHTGSSPPDGLNLSEGQAYSNIVNVLSVQMSGLFRIEPGNPDDSYLVRKIEGNGIVANRMPLNSEPLTPAQIDLVRQWVIEGAENN